MSENYAISMKNICKSFGGISVLNNVDFNLLKGSIHALVGGNGAGKSTLMKIMTGVYTSDSGNTYINGKQVEIKTPIDAMNNGIRMIFQELSLIPTLTVSENIFLAHELKKGPILDYKRMHKQSEELLKSLEIEIDPDARISDLEVGQCQLIEIAKALSTDSTVLVMDEPTSTLTERETDTLFSLMQKLKRKGVSIVYISHRMKEVLEISDRISVLRDGKIQIDEEKEKLTMKTLINHMIGADARSKMEFVKREQPISEENLLEVRGLSLEKKLDNISFNVKKGEVLGLVGLMGSGRTEIVEILAGLRKQGEASIILDGEALSIKDVQSSIDKGIVLVPEDRRRQGLVLQHTLKENICIPNLPSLTNNNIISHSKCDELARECVNDFGIVTDGINTSVFNLSGGNQQKVVISKWFKTNPKLLLLDEPTAGVDIGAKNEIIDIIRHFVSTEKSVIFISSELSEVLAICDRILILSRGKIVSEMLREEIQDEEVLQYAVQH